MLGAAVLGVVSLPFLAIHLAAEWWWSRLERDEPYDTAKPHPTLGETFICRGCGTGPWHKSWGRFCPNCTGAD